MIFDKATKTNWWKKKKKSFPQMGLESLDTDMQKNEVG